MEDLQEDTCDATEALPPVLKERLEVPLGTLMLPTRIENFIARRGLTTVRDLVAIPPAALLLEPNLGRKSVADTESVVSEHLDQSWESVRALLRGASQEDASSRPAFPSDRWAALSTRLGEATLDRLVAEIDVPTRLKTFARARGLVRVRDLVALPLRELEGAANVGRRTVAQALDALETLPANAPEPGDRSSSMPSSLPDGASFVALLLEGFRQLPDRERMIVTQRSGLAGPAVTLAQMGSTLGLSRERVRQLEERALERVRTQGWTDLVAPRLVRLCERLVIDASALATVDALFAFDEEHVDVLTYFIEEVLDVGLHVRTIDGRVVITRLPAEDLAARVERLRNAMRRAPFPFAFSDRHDVLARLVEVPREEVEALSSFVDDQWVYDGADVTGWAGGTKMDAIVAFLRVSGPTDRDELERRFGRFGQVVDELVWLDAGLVGLVEHVPNWDVWRQRVPRLVKELIETHGPDRQWRTRELFTLLAEHADVPSWLNPSSLGSLVRGAVEVRYLGRNVIALAGTDERRVRLAEWLVEVLTQAGRPVAEEELLRLLSARRGVGPTTWPMLRQRAPFLLLRDGRIGLSPRDVPGGEAAIARLTDHIFAHLDASQRGMRARDLRAVVSGLGESFARLDERLVRSLLRHDGRFRMATGGGAVGLADWEDARAPSQGEVLAELLVASDGLVPVVEALDAIPTWSGEPLPRARLGLIAKSIGARVSGNFVEFIPEIEPSAQINALFRRALQSIPESTAPLFASFLDEKLEVDELGRQLAQWHERIRHESDTNPNIDRAQVERLGAKAEAFLRLLATSNTNVTEDVQRIIAAGVAYLVCVDDAEADTVLGGLDDDEAVLEAVARFTIVGGAAPAAHAHLTKDEVDDPSFSVLQRIFDARGVIRPTGQALFSYRITESELAEVKAALSGELAENGVEWAALFCLFASEQIRRTYEGGPWKWEPILEAIQCRTSLSAIYKRVERGLAYLGRSLIRTSTREFWLTLMCEGGLPVRLLEREGAPVTRFLRALLMEVERFPSLDVADVASHLARNVLSPALQNDVFLDFAWRLVLAFRDLRANKGALGRTAAQLDAHMPGWRDRIPMRLDDRVAGQLLAGLLESPREEEEIAPDGLTFETILMHGASPRLVRRLRPAADVSEREVAKLLALPEGATLPSRLTVQVAAAAELHVGAGILLRRSGAGFALELSSSGITLDNAFAATPLVVTHGSTTLGLALVRGAEPLGDSVWVFGPAVDGVSRLVAVGGYRAEVAYLVLALPEELSDERPESGELRPIGALHGRRLFELKGTLSWMRDGRRVVVSTRSTARQRRFRLDGALRRYLFNDRQVFAGQVSVVEQADGGERQVAPKTIEVRHALGGSWTSLGGSSFGDLRVRVVLDDEVVFATRAAVVPADLQIAVQPSSETGVGNITVVSRSVAAVHVASAPTYECQPRSAPLPGTHSFTLRAIGATLPADVELLLRFVDGGELRARVPFPAPVLAFTDRHGRPLPNGVDISIHALTGMHARCIAPAGKVPLVDVEAQVEQARPEIIGRLVERGGLGRELHLESIRDRIELLLSAAEGNASIRLCLSVRGGLYGEDVGIELRRYDGYFVQQVVDDCEALSLVQNENALVDFTPLRVEAIPVWRPRATPEPLVRGDDGRWMFPYAEHASGPWLILGWVGEAIVVRPTCVTVPGGASERVRPLLEEIVRCATGRAEMFERLCTSASQDWDHPDWQGLDEYLETLGTIPPATFDAVRAIVAHPGASIMALLRSSDSKHVVRRWKQFELLPTTWFIRPLREWLLAGVALREVAVRRAEACANAGIADWDTKHFIRELTRPFTLADLPPFTSTIRAAWAALLDSFDIEGENVLTVMRTAQRHALAAALTADRYAVLKTRHADDHWPAVHLGELPPAAVSRTHGLVAELWPEGFSGFRRDVLQLPILAAAAMLEDHRPGPETVLATRRVREFDEPWFDDMHALALAYFVGESLEGDPEFLERMVGL